MPNQETRLTIDDIFRYYQTAASQSFTPEIITMLPSSASQVIWRGSAKACFKPKEYKPYKTKLILRIVPRTLT